MACKDKNDLGPGILWRKVYEIVEGAWRNEGGLWLPGVNAYNISLACNHCEDPACLKACPTRAISRRADGIVLLDGRKCVGCRYCEWSCPYGAPRYDARRGVMTKCDFCADLVGAGGRPACVTACPMRALDFGPLEDLRTKYGGTRLDVPPARSVNDRNRRSSFVRTGARLRVRKGGPRSPTPRRPEMAAREWPLIVFTLLAQTGVGFFLAFTLPIALAGDRPGARPALLRSLALVVAFLAGAAAFSLFHLGNPLNAWRTLGNLTDSWLSREIFFLLLSLGLLTALFLLEWARAGSGRLAAGIAVTAALAGAALILSMAHSLQARGRPFMGQHHDALFFLRDGRRSGGPWRDIRPVVGAVECRRRRASARRGNGSGHGHSDRRRSCSRAPLRPELRHPEGRRGGRRADGWLSRGFPCPDRAPRRFGPVYRPGVAARRAGRHRARCLGAGRAGVGRGT